MIPDAKYQQKKHEEREVRGPQDNDTCFYTDQQAQKPGQYTVHEPADPRVSLPKTSLDPFVRCFRGQTLKMRMRVAMISP